MTNEQILSSDLSKEQKFNAIIHKNGALIKREAIRFSKSNPVCDIEDYEQEAKMVIFSEIMDHYSPEKYKFTTYMVTCIKRAMRKHASKYRSPLTSTPSLVSRIQKMDRLKRDGSTDAEIRISLGISKKQMENLRFISKLNRIDSEIGIQHSDIPVQLVIEDAGLSKEERCIIKLRQEKTLRQVGLEMGFSAEWIRRIEKRALEKVKSVL